MILVIGCVGLIRKLQDQIILIDKEQHIQNKDIIELLKHKGESISTLIQHAEVLEYLVDRDPLLSKTKIIYRGPIGEA